MIKHLKNIRQLIKFASNATTFIIIGSIILYLEQKKENK